MKGFEMRKTIARGAAALVIGASGVAALSACNWFPGAPGNPTVQIPGVGGGMTGGQPDGGGMTGGQPSGGGGMTGGQPSSGGGMEGGQPSNGGGMAGGQ